MHFATHLTADCALLAAAMVAARCARTHHAAGAHLGISLLPSDAAAATLWLARQATRWIVGCAGLSALATAASWMLLGAVDDPVVGAHGALRIAAEALVLSTVAALATLGRWRALLPAGLAASVLALWRGHLAFPLLPAPELAPRIGDNLAGLSADEGTRAMPSGSAAAMFALLALALFLAWLCLSVPRAPRRTRIG